MDAESEGIVREAPVKVMSNRTTMVVAHRLATIRNKRMITVVHLVCNIKRLNLVTHEELNFIKDPEGRR
ncbi:hypothetical protein V6N11_048548 [Hibiscus sabdariffa]|uniref:Uncharacterized protein n=1 Tax=Hibiscus sabdariffa TaxID=183260 RepID=A0ABR2PVH8_9ROSI